MPDFIQVKDANANTIKLHTIEDSTSTHFNQSIPISVSGAPLFVDTPGNVSITNTAPVPVSIVGGALVANVSLGSSSANIGTVSISPTQANIPVSLAPPSYNIPVSLHPVTINAGTALIGAVSIRQIVSVVPDGTGANFPVSIAGTPTFNLGTITGNIGVSIAGMTGNIGVSIVQPSYNMPVSLHPVTINAGAALIGAVSIRQIVSVVPDGTGANFPVSIAGTPTFTIGAGSALIGRVSIANIADVSIQDNAPVSVRGGVLGAVSLGGGTATIGTVNIGTVTGNIGVSIAGQTGNIGVSVINPTFNLPVSIAGTPTFNLGTITGNIGVSIAGVTGNIGVSIGGTNNIGVSVKAGAVSVAGMVTVEPKSNTGAAVPAGAFFVGGTDGSNLRGFLTDTAGAMVITSIKDDVSIAPQTLLVHVCNSLPAAGATPMVSIGGAVSLQAIQIAYRDTGGDARTPLTNTTGNILVHVCNALPTPTGITQLVSVGGAVSTQAVQIAGRDINGDARTPRTHTDGSYLVHVCNAAPGAAGGSSITVSIGDVVSVQAVPIAFRDTGGNSRQPLVTTTGIQIAHVSNVVDVSISPGGLNIPVSVAAGRVSVQGMVTVEPKSNTGAAVPAGAFYVGGIDPSGNLRGFLTDTAGAAVITSIKDDVSIAPQILTVHVCNAAPGGGGSTPVVSVGGTVTVQAVQIAGTDGTNARVPLLDTSGTQKVGGFTVNPEYSFTRPTDVAPYAIGDLVANTTVVGTTVPLSWPVSRITGGGGSFMVRRARLITPNDNRTTDRSYRLHLWNIATGLSVANGDNGIFAPTKVSDYAGYIDIPMHLSANTGAAGMGVPGGGSEINIQLAAGQTSISGWLEARTSILPANAAEYRVILEILQD